MESCQCQGIEQETPNWVENNLKLYRAGTPPPTTALLVNALSGYNLADRALLDIGGGIGVIQLELFRKGVTSATSVEASTAYLEAAQAEAAREGVTDKITTIHGNFVALADSVPNADIVTLDRVICCFDEVEKLVSLSASKARWLYGVTYPVDSLFNKISIAIENFTYWLRRNPFRAFIHPTRLVNDLVNRAGLRQVYRHTVFSFPNVWQIVVYERPVR